MENQEKDSVEQPLSILLSFIERTKSGEYAVVATVPAEHLRFPIYTDTASGAEELLYSVR